MENKKVLKYVNKEDRKNLRKISEKIDMSKEEGKEEAKAISIALLEEVERQNRCCPDFLHHSLEI